ncbi:MAG TPA: MCE family protein [Mycobacterium sp.]|jgi:phospholipid/cholesterol/gamma-HCH transport system substrate-binding protein|nr:MCE family protein [Mycobacterium sp.]
MMGVLARRRLLATSFVVCVALLGGGVVAAYQQAFTSYVPITVLADRTGLLLEKGADVTRYGIVVGKVRDIEPSGDRAIMHVGIYADQAPLVPPGATPAIVAPTIFGAKYIELGGAPPQDASAHIQKGEVLSAADISTEANDVLGNLNTLLTGIDVAKLNSALGAVSTALRGRGNQVGQLLVDTNSYVARLQKSVPGLGADAASADEVAQTYAAATPDLVRTLSNVAVTSRTLASEHDALPVLLASIINASRDTKDVLDKNANGLEQTLRVLRPTSSMLADYAPMFPCLLASVNQMRIHLDKVLGYQYPSLHIYTQLIPGVAPYKYPRDLPRIVPPTPPTCFGGPLRPSDGPVPYYKMDDGSHTFVPSDVPGIRVVSPIPNPPPKVGAQDGPRPPLGSRPPSEINGGADRADSSPRPGLPIPLPGGLVGGDAHGGGPGPR